jgi:hypothetical protein
MDVTKVERDVAMVVHICCKLLFSMFYLFFRHMLQVHLSRCCIRFHTYDASVLSGCCVCLHWFQVFLLVFQTHVSNSSFVFMRMLQLLHLDISKLDRVLHLPPRLFTISPLCQAQEASIGRGGPHWHGRAPYVCERAQQAIRGQTGAGCRTGVVAWASGRGIASGHPGASHVSRLIEV